MTKLAHFVKKIKQSIAIVLIYDKKGNILGQSSGFFISDNGDIITNKHMFQNASIAKVKTAKSEVFCIAHNDYEKAIAYFDNAIKKYPNYAEAHFLIGYCNTILERNTEAAEAYKQAILIKPDYAEHASIWVKCLFANKDLFEFNYVQYDGFAIK